MTDPMQRRWIRRTAQPALWEVYARLCEEPMVRERLIWQHHGLVVRHLVRAGCMVRAARELRTLVGHHLFASAGEVGRYNALASPGHALRLLEENTLPDAATRRRQAPGLLATHLRLTRPGVGEILNRWVLSRADLLAKVYFERRPRSRARSRSRGLWGERFRGTHGRDWYQECLSMMSGSAVHAACRGDLISLLAYAEKAAV